MSWTLCPSNNNTSNSRSRPFSFQRQIFRYYNDLIHKQSAKRQSQFCKVIRVPFLHNSQYQVLISLKLIKNQKIVVKASVLKGGEFFRFTNREKFNYTINIANEINNKEKGIRLHIHPLQQTLSFLFSCSINKALVNQLRKLIQFLTKIINSIEQQISRYLAYILYVSGQIGLSLYCELEQNKQVSRVMARTKRTILSMNKNVIRQKREGELIIYTQNVKEFKQNNTTATDVNMHDKYVAQQQKLTSNSKQDDKTKYNLFQYQKYLIQEPYQSKSPSIPQKLSVYSNIQWEKNQKLEWKIINVKTQSSELYLTKCSFNFNRFPPNNDQQDTHPPVKDRWLICKKYDEKNALLCQREKRILKHMKNKTSKYIAKYYNVIGEKSQKYTNTIVMDFQKQSVARYLYNNQKSVSKSTKLSILIQTIKGLRFLRDISIVHMDLKFQNLLMDNDLNVKISDFGQSCILSSGMKPTRRFSNPYIPPQLFQLDFDRNFSNHIDTFSFGIMIDNIFSNRFILDHRERILAKILKEHRHPQCLFLIIERYLSIFDDDIAQLMVFLIILCLHPVPSKRPTQDAICIILGVIDEVEKERKDVHLYL